ncbi:hypothetical protein RIEPE_0108 [Candidatus Riesia pediculicola USDA]|uniref:Uncharacterized protein n=1 Tax=Riesia pediculicola (strain USDA) TaxID=515618 RepID=D4G7R9_RIEPU|nr:hypothetical protein RIEPE_0108 [Candidatus Riesia pediculicola USDA]
MSTLKFRRLIYFNYIFIKKRSYLKKKTGSNGKIKNQDRKFIDIF